MASVTNKECILSMAKEPLKRHEAYKGWCIVCRDGEISLPDVPRPTKVEEVCPEAGSAPEAPDPLEVARPAWLGPLGRCHKLPHCVWHQRLVLIPIVCEPHTNHMHTHSIMLITPTCAGVPSVIGPAQANLC